MPAATCWWRATKISLEGRQELPEYDSRDPEQQSLLVSLPDGATVRLEARDPEGGELSGVELTVERLDGPPDTLLQAEDFADAKSRRALVSDRSGRAAATGFYPGTYRARARLGGGQARRGLMRVAQAGDRPRQEIDFTIRSGQTVDLEARMVAAGSFSASLVCADGWALARGGRGASGRSRATTRRRGRSSGGHR